MGVFVILLFIPLLLQHAVIGNKQVDFEKRNRRALLFFFLLLTVLVAFRHESVGNDTQKYIYYFNKYSEISWSEIGVLNMEAGFVCFTKIISVFTKEQQVYLTVCAVITAALIYPTYKRLCEDSSLSIVLFCTMSIFVMMFSGIRQMLAVGLGCIAYEYTRNKKLIPFIFMVVLAVTFHTSAFMLIFMYPLYHAKITKKWLLAVVPAMAVIFVFNRQIFSLLTLFLMRYTSYEATATQTGAYTMIFLFAAFAVFAFLIPDESYLDTETIGLRNFLLFSLVLQMFAPLHMLAMRMNYYYIIFIPLLIPKIIECRSERYRQVAVVARHVMVVFFLIYFFINALASSGNLHVFPYHFFWENVV